MIVFFFWSEVYTVGDKLLNILGKYRFLNFRRVLNVVCFLLGNSPATEFYIPTSLSPSFLLAQAIFEPNLFPYKYSNIFKPIHPSYLSAYVDGTDRVFRNVGI